MELLSPAGNIETAIAAFDGGADAVYCGLGKFNARERAENFSARQLGRLLNFAHDNGKKVYLTLNTLVWQNELGELFDHLLQLDRYRPDALIVQDPGVVSIIQKYFPELTLHASTQMGIHNSAGIKCAASLGFKRVILERQIPMEELKSIAENSPLELEVFIHGSLCCSLSGRCLLSNHIYGESGNRGKCKQPCRRTFQRQDIRSQILSPADLCGYELLGELKKLGIASLKIEGRLRSPDYIWKTARAYRIIIDNPGDQQAAAEAQNIFKSVPGRTLSHGFYNKKEWGKLIQSGKSGTFGECCATVEKAIRSGILVKVKTSLHLGDRLRIIPVAGGEGESFTLSSLENYRREKIIKGKNGETLFIHGKFHASTGCEIRRIGENGFDFSRKAASLPDFRRNLQLSLNCSANEFTAEIKGVPEIWKCKTEFHPAEKRPLQQDDVKKVFSESPPEGFRFTVIDISIKGSFFVPATLLKEMRRSCMNFFADILKAHEFFPEHAKKMEFFYQECLPDIPAENISFPSGNVFHIPAFIPEHEIGSWQKKINDAFNSGIRNFTASHWHAFEMLKNLNNINICACYPFHISNSFAVKTAAALGASCAAVTPECPENAVALLLLNSVLPINTANTDIPLLATRLSLPTGVWQCDSKKFNIVRKNGLSLLYSHETLEISGKNKF